MAAETFLQHWIFTSFIYPFLLVFFIVFAILEKSKLLGSNKQTNSIVSFIIGLIFVSAIDPKLIVGNMILFLTVAVIVVFVVLLLWGFISGGELKTDILKNNAVKWTAGISIVVATIIALLWATGIESNVINLLFHQSWSSGFWTNVSFIAIIVAALALVLTQGKGSSSS